ncbi:MAG: cupredoxin domain-containing protein [Alphaproteobacteria bacterium]|nr:cupredoxin domain-containing protein [Alphaproteobacteria bacterium]
MSQAVRKFAAWAIVCWLSTGAGALADDLPTFELAIKDHHFVPETLTVPANTKFKLLVKNQDPTPEEFESYELHREKVVLGNSEIVVFIGPLDPGTYPFFGDFNQNTARGKLIAK